MCVRLAFAILAWVVPPQALTAGVYLATEPVPFAVSESGAVELPYEPQFKSLLDDRLNAANPTGLLELAGKPTPRGAALLQLNGPTARDDDATFGALAVRVGGAELGTAVSRLRPRTRDRIPDYVALVTLAHVHAIRGEWSEAARTHVAAILDAEPPPELPGATAAQTRWLVNLERTHYARWLQLRGASSKPNPATELPPDLFPGLRFVGETGVYEAGTLAATERAKLPPDAVAVVQQLLLWAPDDTRLLWLLGELYAAEGRVREAAKVFDQCTWGRNFTDRAVLMAHQRAVRQVVDDLPPESDIDDLPPDAAPTPEPDPAARWAELRPTVVTVAVGVGAVAVLMLTLQIRAWRRRFFR